MATLGLAAPKLNQHMLDYVLLTNDRQLRDLIAIGLMLPLVQGALLMMRGWAIMYIIAHQLQPG